MDQMAQDTKFRFMPCIEQPIIVDLHDQTGKEDVNSLKPEYKSEERTCRL